MATIPFPLEQTNYVIESGLQCIVMKIYQEPVISQQQV